jgi:peptidyl-prolyl cis-trans isomerase D
VVAQIGRDALTVTEVEKTIDQTVKGRQIPTSVLSNYVPQMVNEMITNRSLAYQAERLGFQVSDADLQATIRQVFPSLFPDGKFVGAAAYASMLATENTDIATFEADLRTQMLVARLRDVVAAGVVVTPADIEQEYRRKNEKIKVQWVKLTSDQYKSESQPAKEEVEAYFKVNAAHYEMAEKKDLAILVADPAKMGESLTPAEIDLQRLYSQNQASFLTPERVKVRHILLKTTGKPATEDAKMKAQAEDLLKQIRGGANFSALAKKYSEDTVSATNAKDPGELPDWITRGQTVAAFESAAFSLKVGQTSDLVKTPYGYHIIQVLAHEAAHQKTLEEAKDELTTQWKKQRVNDLMQSVSDRAQAEVQKDPAHPEKAAAAFNMRIVRVTGFQPNQPLPDVGLSPDFAQSVGGLNQNEVSAPVAVADDKIVLAVVTAATPARPATLAEVEGQVRDALVQTRSANALQQHVQELADAARKSGDLAKTAKSMGLEIKTSEEFARSGSVEGLGSASYLEDAFVRPDNAVVGPIGVPDGTVVAQVVAHIPADMSLLPAQSQSIRDDVKRQKANDRQSLFSDGVRDELLRQGRIKIHQPVIQRIIARYSSPS